MSDGVYRSIEEAADMEINSNFEVVRLVTEELHCQKNMTGVAQAVVDRIGRAHHDTYMNQMCKCQKRDDMTILIRIFKEEIANSLKSPRAAGRQTMPGRKFLESNLRCVSAFKSVKKMLNCGSSKEIYWVVLCCGVLFIMLYKVALTFEFDKWMKILKCDHSSKSYLNLWMKS